MAKRYVVELTPKERSHLLAVVSKGKNKAQVIRRAHILLKSDEGKTDKEITELLYVSEDTVERTRACFWQEGVLAALDGKPIPGQEEKLDEVQEAYLTAIACTEPPDGRSRWTLELLAGRMVADGIVDSLSPTTVRLMLKKRN
jgi:transposase